MRQAGLNVCHQRQATLQFFRPKFSANGLIGAANKLSKIIEVLDRSKLLVWEVYVIRDLFLAMHLLEA